MGKRLTEDEVREVRKELRKKGLSGIGANLCIDPALTSDEIERCEVLLRIYCFDNKLCGINTLYVFRELAASLARHSEDGIGLMYLKGTITSLLRETFSDRRRVDGIFGAERLSGMNGKQIDAAVDRLGNAIADIYQDVLLGEPGARYAREA